MWKFGQRAITSFHFPSIKLARIVKIPQKTRWSSLKFCISLPSQWSIVSPHIETRSPALPSPLMSFTSSLVESIERFDCGAWDCAHFSLSSAATARSSGTFSSTPAVTISLVDQETALWLFGTLHATPHHDCSFTELMSIRSHSLLTLLSPFPLAKMEG